MRHKIALAQMCIRDRVPFDEVSKEHAYKEGEGDRSLAYWRDVHEDFFAEEFISAFKRR